MKLKMLILAPLLLALLIGCASFSVPTPQTFNERLAAGYVSVTGIRTSAATLLSGGVIGSDDAANVQKQADVAREGLDVARTLPAMDAENKLQSTLLLLTAARGYLCSKNPADPNCGG